MTTPTEEQNFWIRRAELVGPDRAAWDDDRDLTHDHVKRILRWMPAAGSNCRIIDLGCGPGRLAIPLTEMGYSVIGIDISHSMVVRKESRFFYTPNDGRTIPFQATSFHGGYSMLLFQHLPAEGVIAYLHELKRVLEPGSNFVFQVSISDSHGDFDHGWGTEVLVWAHDAGFEIPSFELEPDGTFPTWGWGRVVA